MAGESFTRNKEGFRFDFGGFKTNDVADAFPPNKYPLAVNIRGYADHSIRTRPGQAKIFQAGANPITDLNTYTVEGTDNKPRILARDTADAIWLDTGAQVGTLTPGGLGASMIPFRPNASPNSYMYIANGADYQKFSAPNPTVVASKVGIAEPQDSVEAGPAAQNFNEVLSPGGTWNTAGTASGFFTGGRGSDVVVTSQFDPSTPFQEGSIHGAAPPRWSIQVSPNQQYQVGEILYFYGTPPLTTIIEEVIPPLAIPMTVQAIYPTQAFGASINVVTLQNITGSVKGKPVSNQSGQALPTDEVIAQLVRGALIQIGTETTYVRSVTNGPDNQICLEVFLNSAHAAGESVIGLPTIIVNGVQNAASVVAGTPFQGDQPQAAIGNVLNFAVATGVGTLTSGPPGGGPTGTIVARPTTFLNGWGPNAHVGAYETGGTQSFGWGLSPQTTNGYANPANAYDNNLTTFAGGSSSGSPTYSACIWSFPVTASQPGLVLNVNSAIPLAAAIGVGSQSQLTRSAGIWYSLDAGNSWIQIYNVGYSNGGPFFAANSRPQQWDSVPLPTGQVIANVQVMAFIDANPHMGHYVYEINISQGAASIGINTGAYQVEDYLHFSVLVDSLQNMTELKLQFDISDGTFNSNYYYYSVRPSDLVPATQNTVTQLGSVQAMMQETQVNAFATNLNLSISDPTVAGASQWSEIWTPISGLTRVGGDQSKTLATINAVQILVNASGTVNVSVSSIAFVGGGQPDIGDVGEPYRYRVVPYSSVTGAKGNPSPDMRYGVIAHRQQIQLTLPGTVYDPQIDTWWIYRWGGTITSWRWLGQTAFVPGGSTWQDNYDDAAASAGNELEFDNFEPWPSVDVPFLNTAVNLVGFYADVNVTPPSNVTRFLPGNLVTIGGTQAFTLRKRPFIPPGSTLYRFEFVECTSGIFAQGFGVNEPLQIYEPEIARQFLPYMWGPDANGVIFACGDPLRPGTLYGCKPNNPDSAPDTYNQELCAPSEPLLGGVIVDGLSYVGSSERWWALYPQLDNPAQRYAPQQAPLPRGLLGPYGATTDGKEIFWWAGDGVWSSTKGSLIDEDLYTLFPHEGIVGTAFTYGTPPIGKTQNPPDYSRSGTFRLVYWQDYLYLTFQDSGGAYNCLVYDYRRDCWSVDQYAVPVSVIVQPFQPEGPLLTVGGSLYPNIIMGDINGQILQQQTLTNDNTVPIPCTVARFEFDGGDNRAPKQWGDMFVDSLVSAPAGLNVTPMSLGAPVASGTVNIPTAPARQRNSIGMGANPVVSDFMGSLFSWTDDFSVQTANTVLYIWSPSYSILPARIGGATASGGTGAGGITTFGTSFTLPGYGHIGWVSLAYISTAPVTMTITTYDGQSPAVVTLPSTGGQYQKTLFRVSANKGQLFRFSLSCAGQFQVFNDDSDIMVGAWERTGPYADVKTFEQPVVDSAPL